MRATSLGRLALGPIKTSEEIRPSSSRRTRARRTSKVNSRLRERDSRHDQKRRDALMPGREGERDPLGIRDASFVGIVEGVVIESTVEGSRPRSNEGKHPERHLYPTGFDPPPTPLRELRGIVLL